MGVIRCFIGDEFTIITILLLNLLALSLTRFFLHSHQIHDWEVQTTYFNYQRLYKNEEAVLAKMRQAYQEAMPTHNLHFIMGTMAAHPRTFIVIGLLRTGIDPEELGRQGELF